MTSADPAESFGKGLGKAVLDKLDEKTKQLIQQFRERKIAFIQNPQTIETAKEQKNTSEYQTLQQYIIEEKFKLFFQMGLTLRNIEKNPQNWKQLRDRLYKKHGTKGLYIAQFVQNGAFNRYVVILMERGLTKEQISEELNKFLNDIEITNSYIQKSDNVENETRTILTRIRAHNPHTYIISGSKKDAMRICTQVKNKVMLQVRKDYKVESYSTDITKIYFLKKKIKKN